MLSFITNLAEITLFSTIVIIGVLLIRGLFAKRLHILFLSLLWLIVLARLIIPVTIESPIKLDSILSIKNEANNQNEDINEDTQHNNLVVDDSVSSSYAPSDEKYLTSNLDNKQTSSPTDISKMQNSKPSLLSIVKSFIMTIYERDIFWKVIAIIWLCGAWIAFLRNYFAIYDFNRKVKSCVEVKNERILKDLVRAKKVLAVSKAVRIYECEFINTPVTYGLSSPKILIPKNFYYSIDDDKMLFILLHELSHIKSHDIIKNYTWLLVRIVYWFNPIVTIAYKKYLEDIEYICDYSVLRIISKNNVLSYSQILLDSLKFSKNYIKVPTAISFCKSKSLLRKRVEIMLKPHKKSKIIETMTAIICVILVITCFTTACTENNNLNAIATKPPQNIEKPSTTDNATSEEPVATTPKEVKTIDISSVQKPIKQNPVGSKESALARAKEIATRLDIPNDQGFQYINLSHIPPFHSMHLKDDPINNIWIYDFNGEVKYLQTNAYLSDDEKPELDEEQLKECVVEFSNRVYPDTILNIKSIEILNREWKEQGTTVNNIRYVVSGDLFDKIDSTTRKFRSTITPRGEILTISAEYNGLDYLNISDESIIQLLENAGVEYTELNLFQRDERYGEYMLHFSLGSGVGAITVLESDMSLIDYVNIPNDTDAKCNLTNDDIDRLTKQYLDQFFPDNTDYEIAYSEKIRDDCIVEGTFQGKKGETDFYILLNGDGKVHKIGIRPNIDKTSLEKIDKQTAFKTAIDTILSECPFASKESLKLISEEEYKDEYIEAFAFKFEYTSQNPTIRDYSFTTDIKVDIYSNKPSGWRIDYVKDGLELMTEEEVIKKAKEYIVDEFDVNSDKLVYKEFLVLTGYILEFQANFDYDDGRSFGVSMLADTGELDGIGWGE